MTRLGTLRSKQKVGFCGCRNLSAILLSVITVPTGEPALDLLRQDAVADEDQGKPQQIGAGQMGHPKAGSESRVWSGDSEGHYHGYAVFHTSPFRCRRRS